MIEPILDSHGLSDPGLARSTNGDQFLIARLARTVVVEQTTLAVDDATRLTARRPGLLFLVADGLGDAPIAQRASSLAAQATLSYVLNTMPWFWRLDDYEEELEDELHRAMERCQRRIEAEVEENPSCRGMGTMLTVGYVLWPRLYIVHVGSGRAYLWRKDRLERMTRDQVPPEDEPGGERMSRAMWSVLGGETSEVRPDVYRAELAPGDAVLLCTDGLWRQVPDAQMAGILSNAPSARAACESLIDAASEAGGVDNATSVVVRFPTAGTAPGRAGRTAAEAALPAQ